MNTHHQPTTARRLSLVVAGLAAALTAVTTPATATPEVPSNSSTCQWTVDQLPRTPDAVEGWYRPCQVQRLGTADATEGWLR
jgi:hypothetical protein